MTNQISKKIINKVANTFEKDPSSITLETRFEEDLNADSLIIVEMIMEFEEEFDIEIPDDEARKLKTVGDVVKYVEDLQS